MVVRLRQLLRNLPRNAASAAWNWWSTPHLDSEAPRRKTNLSRRRLDPMKEMIGSQNTDAAAENDAVAVAAVEFAVADAGKKNPGDVEAYSIAFVDQHVVVDPAVAVVVVAAAAAPLKPRAALPTLPSRAPAAILR